MKTALKTNKGKHKSKTKWICEDCNGNTSAMYEHYFVHTPIWESVHPSEEGMLCIGCLEARLGRTLTGEDFPPVHINNPRLNSMSSRLLSRIQS